jgi:outer membrane protein TolC
MGEVIRQDSEDIAVLRAELEQAHNDYVDAQREVERLRAALEIIAGPGESDVYIAAGGGYEGLQAIARDALAGT